MNDYQISKLIRLRKFSSLIDSNYKFNMVWFIEFGEGCKLIHL